MWMSTWLFISVPFSFTRRSIYQQPSKVPKLQIFITQQFHNSILHNPLTSDCQSSDLSQPSNVRIPGFSRHDNSGVPDLASQYFQNHKVSKLDNLQKSVWSSGIVGLWKSGLLESWIRIWKGDGLVGGDDVGWCLYVMRCLLFFSKYCSHCVGWQCCRRCGWWSCCVLCRLRCST